MKKKLSKILGVGLTLALLVSMLLTAAPVMAEDPVVYLEAVGAPVGTTDTIVIEVPAGTTLGQIDSIAWSEYLIQGYPPHVDIILDMGGDDTDALVFEYAHNTDSHYADGPMPYGALTGAWYPTFSDDTEGPVEITDTSFAWLSSGAPGPYPDGAGFIGGTLAEWTSGSVDVSVNANTPVLHLEIEIDNWVVDSEALVKDIILVISGDIGLVDLDATSPGEIIGISVSTALVSFGELVPGTVSVPQSVVVTNTGNVAVDLDATLENELPAEFYTDNLTLGPGSVDSWSVGPIPSLASTPPLDLVLSMPSGTPAGDYTATLVFWAIIATP